MSSAHHRAFPFKTVLSLRLLVEYWEERIRSGEVPAFAEQLLAYINQAPELRQPIDDYAVLEKHRTFINFLMTAAIPLATASTDLMAVVEPFNFRAIYTTPAFNAHVDLANFEEQAVANVPGGRITLGKTLRACLMILEKYQDGRIVSSNPKPVLVTLKDNVTGLDRVYKAELSHQFCEIIPHITPEPIDKGIIKFLIEKLYDVDLWLQYFRPGDYTFQGFLILRMIDVTEQEMLSSIKYDLLERQALMQPESFNRIEYKVRSLFGLPDIRMNIAYLDPSNRMVISYPATERWTTLLHTVSDLQGTQRSGSVYERSWSEQRNITVENLQEYPFRSRIEEDLLAEGVRSVLLAPLVDEGETIGMLELVSPAPGQLNPVSAHKMEHVLPMFTTAVKRVKEELSTEVRALIQEECTAIHATVQWRFFEAGVNLMNKRRTNDKAVLEEIVFKDVYPLFGMADVRNSSIERNVAIQRDLQENLVLAGTLLHTFQEHMTLPLLDAAQVKIEEHFARLSRGLVSSDESDVLDFLKQEIHPLLARFESETSLQPAIGHYRAQLDPFFGVVYTRRQAFEESLQQINHTIGACLDDADDEAQKMFPHYFEKYKTDGVEFTLYLGSSLLKDRQFDTYSLQNFRLWQLLTMVDIARKVTSLKATLKAQLDITQLILVHDQPLSIRFRPDERQFDVDGAYDIRYEIVKKRIDKACIKNTGERLTQPGKIAIVYNQVKIEDEYERYFHYLRARNLIEGVVEVLELEPLPGATGLRALRIAVAPEEHGTNGETPSLAAGMEEALRLL
ncbi:GAF domain-containing protein [Dawidia soli]|uniref:GAF domain-containing protein n=1 Tax=Dawidia soli TaxID=2782352 RepID=A0AAP2GGB4_9BACT|nr:GAF domain-containing protein [Dawidia soli]MBT1685340.1 GAF domain-containing protein [Dawidia soli]